MVHQQQTWLANVKVDALVFSGMLSACHIDDRYWPQESGPTNGAMPRKSL